MSQGPSTIVAYDGTYEGYDSVGSTPKVFVVADFRAALPDFTSDVNVSDVEVSVADPNAVLHIVIGRVELFEATGAMGGHYHRDTPSGNNLPGIAAYSFPHGFHHVLGAYFLSGGHPLLLNFNEPLEAFKDAETGTDQAVAIWIKRVDSEDAIGYHLNVRFEVND